MAADLWDFVDAYAEALGVSASALLERWTRERRDAVRGAGGEDSQPHGEVSK